MLREQREGVVIMDDNKIIILTLTKREVVSLQASLMFATISLMGGAIEIDDTADDHDDDMERREALELAATLNVISKKIRDQRKEQE